MCPFGRVRMSLEKNIWFRIVVVLLALIGGLFLASQIWAILGQISDIILVLFLAWLLAFLLRPVAAVLIKWGLPDVAAVGLVYLALLLGIVLSAVVIVPLIVTQLAQIGQVLPTYAEQSSKWVLSLQEEFNRRNISVDLNTLYNVKDLTAQLTNVGTLVVQNAIGLATGIASAFLNLILILVISFYITLDGHRIAETLLDVVPDAWQDEVRFVLESVDRKFGGFLRGQLIQAIIYGFGTAVIMAWAGLNYVEVASLVAALLMFIPFFGPFLGIIPPILVAVLSLPFGNFLVVGAALLVLQLIILNVIAPKVMAEAVGMHPILVFLALLLGIKIAGPLGAIFGVPVLAVIHSVAALYYGKSRSVQRRRSVRLGLAPAPDVGCEDEPPGSVSEAQAGMARRALLRLVRRFPRPRSALAGLAAQFKRSQDGGLQ